MKILVVDDERAIRNSLKEILGDEGYEVDTAEDGTAVLAAQHPAALQSVQILAHGHRGNRQTPRQLGDLQPAMLRKERQDHVFPLGHRMGPSLSVRV